MRTAQRAVLSSSLFSSVYPWLVVCCGMLFYCYNYFLRVSPSVMQVELTDSFHITATQFGALAAFYYYAYTPMQIPAGMIYDKFGVRLVLSFACLIAVLGLSIFISADNYMMAGVGRCLIGLGTAFSYIGTLKLASIWLPANRFATVAGLTTAIGMTSGALSQKYLTTLIAALGYKESLHGALIAGIVLSAVILVLVRSKPRVENNNIAVMTAPINVTQLLSALRIIFTNPQMWLIGAIGCLLYLPSSVFLDLWGIPYLETVYGLTPEQAVTISGYTFYGWIISGPIIGIVSDKIKSRCFPLTFTGSFAAILLCVVFYAPGIQPSMLSTIFFMIGFCCGAHPLCFALGKENNPIQISGTAVASTNMLIMLGGAVFQPVVGELLDFHTSSPLSASGASVYSASDYTFALSIVPLGVALGIVLSLFLKETRCESQAKAADELLLAQGATTIEVETPALDPEAEPTLATEGEKA